MPCPKCPNVIFCSEKCLDTAQKSYHGYECHILPLIWKSGCSITCQIALRMITQNNKEYFTSIYKDLEEKPTGPYKTNDYRNIFHLVSHEEKRTKQDILHRTEMTTFLVKLLELSGYFTGNTRTKPVEIGEIKTMSIDDKYKEDVALFGSLILKNLQILQFNAHEVFELQCPKPKVGKNLIKHNGTSVFLAGAVFPTLALFNHSCDPSVVRYDYLLLTVTFCFTAWNSGLTNIIQWCVAPSTYFRRSISFLQWALSGINLCHSSTHKLCLRTKSRRSVASFLHARRTNKQTHFHIYNSGPRKNTLFGKDRRKRIFT